MSIFGSIAGGLLGSMDPTGTLEGMVEGAIDGKTDALEDEHEEHRAESDTLKTIGDATGLTDMYEGAKDIPGIGTALKVLSPDQNSKMERGGIKVGSFVSSLLNPFGD